MVSDRFSGRIERVELRIASLPLRTPFISAAGKRSSREVLLVRVRGERFDGWGECAAFEEPSYTSETIATAVHVIREHLAPTLGKVHSLPELAAVWAWVRGHRMAKAAVEAAVVDALGRLLGVPAWALVGGQPRMQPAGAAIGVKDSLPDLLEAVGEAVAQGYSRVKLKVRPGWEISPTRVVRERFPDLVLWVDANGAFQASDLDVLREFDQLGLAMIEQPLPAEDLVGLGWLQRQLCTPVCLDESVHCLGDLEAAAALGAGRVLNLKPGRVGGLLAARVVAARARELGFDVAVGGMLESSLGRAACLHLQTLPSVSLPGDLSAPGRYLAADLVVSPLELGAAGSLTMPAAPGLGVELVGHVVRSRPHAVIQCSETGR
jgi:O-succinylbenzoate synthase